MVKFLMVFLCLILLPSTTLAQDSDPDSCSALIEQALASVGDHCDDLDRNSACYGHYRVDAHFIETDVDLQFDSPADRVMLTDLHSIATAPYDLDEGQWGVAVLKVQANLPDTLPGQAVTFLLMGDAQISDGTASAEAAPPVTLVEATANSNANLRSGPGTDYNIAGSATAGQTLTLNGTNASRDWYRISDDTDMVTWIWGNLIDADAEALSTLPVVTDDAAPMYGPMEVFTLSTGVGLSDCREAPDGLLIDAPPGQHATVMVNGLQLVFSSAAFLTAYPDDVMTVQGLTGSVEVTAFDQTVTVIPGAQTTIPLLGLEASGPPSEPETAADLGNLPGLRRTAAYDLPYEPDTASDITLDGAIPDLTDGVIFDETFAVTGVSSCEYGTSWALGDVFERQVTLEVSEDGRTLIYPAPSRWGGLELIDLPYRSEFSYDDGGAYVHVWNGVLSFGEGGRPVYTDMTTTYTIIFTSDTTYRLDVDYLEYPVCRDLPANWDLEECLDSIRCLLRMHLQGTGTLAVP